MLYPVLRFLTLVLTLGANYLSKRPRFAWEIFQARSDAYLGERWNVWQELESTTRSFTRGLAGTKRQKSVFSRILIGI